MPNVDKNLSSFGCLVWDFKTITSRHLMKSRGWVDRGSWVVSEDNARFCHIGPDGPDNEKCIIT